MTVRECIINFLQEHTTGIDDDSLACRLGINQRQQVNRCCRQLESEGFLTRQVIHGKIHNIWLLQNVTPLPLHTNIAEVLSLLEADQSKPWFWEGNVQAAVARYLISQSWNIESLANTATKEPGKDIIAQQNGTLLWLSVKGYPEGTKKTRHSTQAGHWFKHAIFDIIAYRGENANAELGLALPDFPRYHSLAHKISWFQPVARFAYYWVTEDGMVEIQ